MDYPLLIRMWQLASKDLGIQISTPVLLTLLSGNQVNATLLVRYFGAEKGTLIFCENSELNPYAEELIREGYGYSVMSEPNQNEQYSREDFIELLREWGWTGSEVQKPIWL